MVTKKNKILYFVTEDWYFCSHRLPIARAAKDEGFEVVVVTRVQKHARQIIESGFKLIPLNIDRSKLHLLKDLKTIVKLIKIYRIERPDIVHHIALKPVIYGSIAAMNTHVPGVVNALTGMGYVFISQGLMVKIIRFFLKYAFRLLFNRRNTRLILQNHDDISMLSRAGILEREKIALIRGSGVDLNMFIPLPEPKDSITVVLASRMLWDKGVGEFVEAARILKSSGVNARFVLAGDTDTANPSAIPVSELRSWHSEGVIEWLGNVDKMPHLYAESNIVCLPSYREGIPKVLIEAASCARPIVTTDVPGCREVVINNINGLLVPVKNAQALAEALRILIESPSLRIEMGEKGRELVKKEFSIEKVVSETLAVYRKVLSS